MKKKYAFVHISISLFLSFQCASLFQSHKIDPLKTADQILDEVWAHAARMQTYQGVADIAVQSSDNIFQGLLHLKMKSPDTLWMKLEGPMSVDLVLCRMTGDDIQIFSPWENTVYNGNASTVGDKALLPVPFDLKNLLMAFSGLLYPASSYADSILHFQTDESYYNIHFTSHDHIWISPLGPAVVRWEKQDIVGDPVWIWEAKSFRKSGPVYLPEKIRMVQPDSNEKILLSFHRFKSNCSFKSNWLDIRLPESVMQVEL